MKTKFTLLIVLQMILLSSVMANQNEENYDNLCIFKPINYSVKCIKEKELYSSKFKLFKRVDANNKNFGYDIIFYKKKKYYYFLTTLDQDEITKCKEGEVILYPF